MMTTGRYQGVWWPTSATILYERSVCQKIVKAYQQIVCHADNQNVIQCMVKELLCECKNICRYENNKCTVLT